MGKGTFIAHQTGAVLCDIVGVAGLAMGEPGAVFGVVVGGLLHYEGLPHQIKEKVSSKLSSFYKNIRPQSREEALRRAYDGLRHYRNILILFDMGIAAKMVMHYVQGDVDVAASSAVFDSGVLLSTAGAHYDMKAAKKGLEHITR